jgi:ABC transporter with metal-binding/Fe-S-binding domain ATP-binding protein
MKLAVLYSGGKDSNYALYKASKHHEIKCLISLISQNQHSYMFQSPGIKLTKFQSYALNIPLIEYRTKGEKEKELEDLKEAIKKAKNEYKIEGIVTGAIESIYQSSRIQKICKELDLWCYNPIWQKNQVEFLKELLENNFEIIVVGIATYPLTQKYLGRAIDDKLIEELIGMQKKYKINPAGEGGELETFVTNSPIFKKKIQIIKSKKKMDSQNSGELIIEDVRLIKK